MSVICTYNYIRIPSLITPFTVKALHKSDVQQDDDRADVLTSSFESNLAQLDGNSQVPIVYVPVNSAFL